MRQQGVAMSILNQIHGGNIHIGEYLSAIFDNTDITVWWKDKNSVWQGANHTLIRLLGLKHSEEVIGKNDFDLCSEEAAQVHMTNDHDVTTNGVPKINIIEPEGRKGGEKFLINVTKIPVYDHGDVVGTVGFGSILQHKFDYYRANNYLKNFYQTSYPGKHFFIITDNKTVRLRERQAEVLTHLSMGKTVKQIASLLDCSTYNIEDHIDRLKDKLGVYTTAALIDCFWNNPIRWFE